MKFIKLGNNEKMAFVCLMQILQKATDPHIVAILPEYQKLINLYFEINDPAKYTLENWGRLYSIIKTIADYMPLLPQEFVVQNGSTNFVKGISFFFLFSSAMSANAILSINCSWQYLIYQNLAEQFLDIHRACYKNAENQLQLAIDQDPYLKGFKKYINAVGEDNQDQSYSYLSFDFLQSHVLRKNDQARRFGLPYHGECLINPGSDRVATIDPQMIEILMARLEDIGQNRLSRTQFIVYMGAARVHALTLDAAFNQRTKILELICVDSTFQPVQWDFLKLLTTKLGEKKIAYDLLACSSGLQKDAIHCKIFSLAISAELSKLSFAQLKKSVLTVEESSQIIFRNGTSQQQKLSDYPALPDVQWIPVTALGLGVVKMHQSFTEMRASLEKMKMKDVNKGMAEWLRLYEFSSSDDLAKRKTYIDYRIKSLKEKHHDEPTDLEIDKVLTKMEATFDQALRRFATGLGPKREMAFLLESDRAPDFIDKVDENKLGRTALHWAFITDQPARACLLLEKNARFDIQDRSDRKLTALDYFKESKSERLKNNEYIRGKLLSKT